MSGVSRSVSRLVPLLEASPSFAEATFFAPTTRLPNNQGDRFHLDAKLVPPGSAQVMKAFLEKYHAAAAVSLVLLLTIVLVTAMLFTWGMIGGAAIRD